MTIYEILDQVFLGNPVWQWGLAVLVVVAVTLIIQLIRTVLARKVRRLAERTPTDADDLLRDLLAGIKPGLMFVVALYAGSLLLSISDEVGAITRMVVVFAALIQVALWANVLLAYGIRHFVRSDDRSEAANQSAATIVTFVGRVVLWSAVLLLALDNIPGVEVTSLLAGLGVAGIAVALALQNILSDLFGSLTILLDQPFAVGDFIIVDDLKGTVERIGLKTTRVRSIYGEELVFSNSDLISSRIRNFKTMQERLVIFRFGVTYDTPSEKLSRIPGIIQDIIEARPDTRFDRSHFKEFGDFSLNFETVYYLLNPDYTIYMDTQQAINLEVIRRFEEESIEFAFPTQTLHVFSPSSNHDGKRAAPRRARDAAR